MTDNTKKVIQKQIESQTLDNLLLWRGIFVAVGVGKRPKILHISQKKQENRMSRKLPNDEK